MNSEIKNTDKLNSNAHNVLSLPEAKSYELKFSFETSDAKTLLGWLCCRCQKDPQYYKNIVSSIYYDTPNWHSLEEKVNSDYLKNKIRLRWYSDIDSNDILDNAFIELKSRAGAQRTKIRYKIDLSAHVVSKASLQSEILRDVPNQLLNDILLPTQLTAVYIVQYHRYRFIEPVTQARVCLDTHINIPKVNSNIIAMTNPRPLPIGVIEVKGQQAKLPAVLHQLTALGCEKSSFSKYLHCYEHLTHQPICG